MDEPSKPEVGIIKKSRAMRLFKPAKKQLRIGIALLVVAVAFGAILYTVLKPARIAPPPTADISDVSDYSEMSYEQKNHFLYTKTGLTIEHLKSQKKLTARTFKTFDAARQSGELFFTLGDYNIAKQAYSVAEKKGVPAYDYEFYLNYAYAALLDKDEATWKQQMLKAKDVAAQLPKTDGANDGSVISRSIQSQIILTEAAKNE